MSELAADPFPHPVHFIEKELKLSLQLRDKLPLEIAGSGP
jgi:hypothetical protein